jgi:Ser/Thr protein kinase RdoA (MazF antagonist)
MQAMNPNSLISLPFQSSHIEVLRSSYGLSALLSATSVAGGLSHRLVRIGTAEGDFALKILSPRSVESDEGRTRLERSEGVAQIAERNGIPALVAKAGRDGKFLQCLGEEWVMLFDWREGEVLPPTAASEEIATEMGAILGRLHGLKIRFEDQGAPEPEAFAEGYWEEMARTGRAENAEWAGALEEALPKLVEANRRAMAAQLALGEGWVMGHLDLDQKNVLWHKGKPTVLDFESAKPIHPALELMGSGLSWAGQSAGDAQEEVFKAFLRGYRGENAVSDEELGVGCDAVLGKWLIWLEFNLRRSLESGIRGTDEERICLDALWHALGATLKLLDDIPVYRQWCGLNTSN